MNKGERSFREAVRQLFVKQPTQFGFSKKDWDSFFQSIESTTDDDRQLYEAGLWFFKHLEAVRKKLMEFPEPSLDKDTIYRMYVGMINRDHAVIRNAYHRDLLKKESSPISSGAMIEKHLPIGPGGSPVHLRGAIETEVSAIRYPLAEAYKAKLTLNRPHSDLEVIKTIKARLNLAILYDNLSDLWEECLWNGWSVSTRAEVDLILPPVSREFISKVVSEHRSDSLLMELTWRSMRYWAGLTTDLKQPELNRLRVTRFKTNKRKREIKLGCLKDSQFPPLTLLANIAAEELYWNEILLQPLPKIANLTIRDLLSVWTILGSLGSVLEADFTEDTGVNTIRKLLEFAPVIPVSELKEAVVRATGLQYSKVLIALDLFFFKGNVREDPWFRPIIQLPNEECTVIIPGLTVPNLIRSIESWMRDGGLDLSGRGGAFEDYVRTRISGEASSSRCFSKSIVRNRPLRITADGKSEEIDLVWIIGSTILIGEVKCALYPASALEYYKYFGILSEAAAQAKRKATFISNNKEKLLAALKVNGVHAAGGFVVQPLVIINLPLGVGFPIEGVPVVDTYVLSRYIEGHQKFFVQTSLEGEAEALFEKTFYSTANEAQYNIVPYLLHPPLITLLSKMVDRESIPLLQLEKEEKVKAYVRYFVKEPDMGS
jgi:hypothetical protein